MWPLYLENEKNVLRELTPGHNEARLDGASSSARVAGWHVKSNCQLDMKCNPATPRRGHPRRRHTHPARIIKGNVLTMAISVYIGL